jgi:hypothetical protein
VKKKVWEKSLKSLSSRVPLSRPVVLMISRSPQEDHRCFWLGYKWLLHKKVRRCFANSCYSFFRVLADRLSPHHYHHHDDERLSCDWACFPATLRQQVCP